MEIKKKKFIFIKKTKVPDPVNITPRPKIKKIIPVGRWCEYYENRLPYPVECQFGLEPPGSLQRPNCPKCKRPVLFREWKAGLWKKISELVQKGEDLSNEPNPFEESYEEEDD